MDFKTLGLKDEIIKGLQAEGIETPTKVQELVIPKIAENKDIIIQSETGSGKTLAYLIPIYQRQTTIEKGMQVLILVPIHELAMQVHHQIESLSKNTGIDLKSVPAFGSASVNVQIEKLKSKPHFVVGTPGRIAELIKLKKISAHTIKTVIIDEADKMLSKDNINAVKAILKSTMRDTQILMVSASISPDTLKQAQEISKNPEVLKTSDKNRIPENIEHMYIVADERDKIDVLKKVINALNPERALIFINNPVKIDAATNKLKYNKYNAECICGANDSQSKKKALDDFKSGKLQLLIATDIAARGLHIEGISTVISLSISEDPMDYLHRSGRTGRQNGEGLSISIATVRELAFIKNYENTFGIKIVQKQLSNGKIMDMVIENKKI